MKVKNRKPKKQPVDSYSNFVTAPDTVTEPYHTVTLIDIDSVTVQMLATYCKMSKECYNVYLYSSDTGDTEWLQQVIAMSHAVILDTGFSLTNNIKAELLQKSTTYYLSPTNMDVPAHRIGSVAEYFITRERNIK